MVIATTINPDFTASTRSIPEQEPIPAREPTPARFGTAFNRDFIENRGTVEVADGVQAPMAKAEACVATTAIATVEYFWSLRVSVSVFNQANNSFITEERVLREFPLIEEKVLALLHLDSFWRSKDELTKKSLATEFRETISHLAGKGEQLAYLLNSVGLPEEHAKAALQVDADKALATLKVIAEEALFGARRRSV